jgi:hypothetical protein
MTSPACHDPATDVIHAVMAAMRAVFSTKSECPPLGGGSDKVWLFAGEGAPLDEVNCNQPYLWVRVGSRFKSEVFPEPSVIIGPCGAQEVIVVEVGVGRCALTGDPTLDQYTDEARVGLDDSWRLSKIPCLVAGSLDGHQVGCDTIVPYGPEGGIIAWTTTMFIST